MSDFFFVCLNCVLEMKTWICFCLKKNGQILLSFEFCNLFCLWLGCLAVRTLEILEYNTIQNKTKKKQRKQKQNGIVHSMYFFCFFFVFFGLMLDDGEQRETARHFVVAYLQRLGNSLNLYKEMIIGSSANTLIACHKTPNKFNPILKPVLTCIQRNECIEMQMRSANALAFFLFEKLKLKLKNYKNNKTANKVHNDKKMNKNKVFPIDKIILNLLQIANETMKKEMEFINIHPSITFLELQKQLPQGILLTMKYICHIFGNQIEFYIPNLMSIICNMICQAFPLQMQYPNNNNIATIMDCEKSNENDIFERLKETDLYDNALLETEYKIDFTETPEILGCLHMLHGILPHIEQKMRDEYINKIVPNLLKGCICNHANISQACLVIILNYVRILPHFIITNVLKYIIPIIEASPNFRKTMQFSKMGALSLVGMLLCMYLCVYNAVCMCVFGVCIGFFCFAFCEITLLLFER